MKEYEELNISKEMYEEALKIEQENIKYRWSDSEMKILIRFYKTLTPIQLSKMLPNKTYAMIRGKRDSLRRKDKIEENTGK